MNRKKRFRRESDREQYLRALDRLQQAAEDKLTAQQAWAAGVMTGSFSVQSYSAVSANPTRAVYWSNTALSTKQQKLNEKDRQQAAAKLQKLQQVARDAVQSTEPIVGHRFWRVLTSAPRLNEADTWLELAEMAELEGASLAQALRAQVTVQLASLNGSPWTKGQRFSCNINPLHTLLDMTCTCGYWALRSEEAVAKRCLHPSLRTMPWNDYKYAVGTVNLYGTIIEHKGGYRAEYAIPKSIKLFNCSSAIGERLQQTWGCQVVHDRGDEDVSS